VTTTLDAQAVRTLLDRARREVDEGHLPSVQIALGLHGEIVVDETFGDATADSRYVIFSSTKAFIASVMWQLIAEGRVDVSKLVIDVIPEFGTNGKDVITIEQVMLHTSGFPSAPMRPLLGATSAGRTEKFAQWRLNWEPGTAFEYHTTAAHWVLAEIIERVTGQDFRDVVEERVTGPLGLPRVLGVDRDAAAAYAPLTVVGEPATREELLETFGIEALPVTEVTPEAVRALGAPEVLAVGIPGGGGFMRARDLAGFYQGLLHNPGGIWDPATLADATGRVRNNLPDRWTGVPASRGLGVVIAGDDGKSHLRGFGRTVSPRAFGHNGAYGQIAWGDPATGLSLGYCTNGVDINDARHSRRTAAIGSLAAVCAK
jgi:CubicO group peptidase (beta-lactamase class C family)